MTHSDVVGNAARAKGTKILIPLARGQCPDLCGICSAMQCGGDILHSQQDWRLPEPPTSRCIPVFAYSMFPLPLASADAAFVIDSEATVISIASVEHRQPALLLSWPARHTAGALRRHSSFRSLTGSLAAASLAATGHSVMLMHAAASPSAPADGAPTDARGGSTDGSAAAVAPSSLPSGNGANGDHSNDPEHIVLVSAFRCGTETAMQSFWWKSCCAMPTPAATCRTSAALHCQSVVPVT